MKDHTSPSDVRESRPVKAVARIAVLALAIAAIFSPHAHAQTDGTWNTNASGNWSATNNWLNGLVANGAGSTANLTFNINAGRTVTNDTAVTLGILNIGDTDGSHAYTLAAGAGSLTFSNNGSAAQLNQVSTSKGDTISSGFTINDNLSISNASSSNTLTLTGVIAGSKAITVNAGSVQFNNASSSYSGGTILTNTGIIRLGGNNVLGTGTLTLGGGTLAGSGTSARSLTNAINLSGTVQVSDSVGTGNITLSGAIGGSGTINKFTTNTLVMTNANSFGGSIYVNEGVLSGTSGSGTAFGTAAIYLGNTSGTGNSTIQFAGQTYGNAITVQAGSSNNALTMIAGAGGTTTLTGGMTLNQAVTLDSTSGTLTFSTTGITGSSTIYVTNSAGTPIPTSHRVNLNVANAGFTGSAVVLSNGTLRITTGAGLSSNNTVQLNSGGLLEVNTGTATIGGLNDNAGAGGTVSVVTSSRTLALAGSGNYSFSGVLQDNGASKLSLTKSGTGIQRLSGSNTYTGTTTVSGGVLRLDSANALPGGIGATGGLSALVLDGGVIGLASGDFSRNIVGLTPGATDVGWLANGSGGFAAFGADRNVNFGGAGASVSWSASGGVFGTNLVLSDASADAMVTIVNPINLSTSSRNVTVNNGSAAVDATMGGSLTNGSLAKLGAGVLALTTSNSIGTLNISAGTVRASHANALGTSSGTTIVQLTSGATLELDANVTAGGGITGSGGTVTAVNASRALTTRVTSGNSQTFSGVLQDGGANVLSLEKIGGGTQVLAGNSTYTGTTTVTAGSLIINGNNSGATGSVSVASGAILGGSGTIGGATTISGSLRPGNSIGTLTVSNSVTWNSNDAWVFELGTAAATMSLAGSGSSTQDLLNITAGDFTKGTGVSWGFDFAGTGELGWYKLVDWSGSTTFASNNFTASNLGSGFTGNFEIDATTSALYLNVVPEPSTYALLVLAGAGFGAHVLRRRRRS